MKKFFSSSVRIGGGWRRHQPPTHTSQFRRHYRSAQQNRNWISLQMNFVNCYENLGNLATLSGRRRRISQAITWATLSTSMLDNLGGFLLQFLFLWATDSRKLTSVVLYQWFVNLLGNLVESTDDSSERSLILCFCSVTKIKFRYSREKIKIYVYDYFVTM